MKSKYKIGIPLFFLMLSNSLPVQAQCSMCRASLISEEGKQAAEAINDGILYLMVFPYILMFVAIYLIFKKNK